MVPKKINNFSLVAHLILLAFQYMFWEFTIDTAFISLRYAQNFYEHQQMVFNVDETPVEGYSSFLWIVWISISFIIKLDPLVFSKLSGAIFCHISVIVLYKIAILLNKDRNFGNFVVLIYVLTPNITLWSVGGLETPLFSLLLLISVYFFITDITKRKEKIYNISPFALLLLSLTRPEGMIAFFFTLVFFFYLFFREKTLLKIKSLLKILFFGGSYLILYLSYFFWRSYYYNAIIPHLLIVEIEVFSIDALFARIFYYLPILVILIPAIILLVFSVIKNSRNSLSNSIKLYIIITLILFALTLLFFRSWMPGYRLIVPILPLLYLVLPKSLNFLIVFKNFQNMDIDFIRKTKFATIFTIGTFCFSLLFSFYPLIKYYGFGISGCNVILGKWINKYTDENASLGVGDIGAISFYAGIRTIDLSPQSSQNIHLYHNPEDIDYILNQNITFFVLKEPYLNYLWGDPLFNARYKYVCQAHVFFEGQLLPNYIYLIFVLKDYDLPEFAIAELLDSSKRFYI